MGVNLGVKSALSRAEFRLKFSNSFALQTERLIRERIVRSKVVSVRPGRMESHSSDYFERARSDRASGWMAESDGQTAIDRLKWIEVGDGQSFGRRMSK